MALWVPEFSKAQNQLSNLQAIPVVGAFISVAKIAVSLVQLVIGVALTLFGGLITVVSKSSTYATVANLGLAHTGNALGGLFYSAVNIPTLGLVAYRFQAYSLPTVTP